MPIYRWRRITRRPRSRCCAGAHGRDLRDAGLALLLAIACTQIKNPGIFWALTLVPGVAVALAPRHAGRFAAVGFGGTLVALVVLAQTSATIFNYRLHLEFDPVWAALGESLFLLGNWHLLWYAALVIAVLARREIAAPALLPLTFVIAGGMLFLFVALAFTNARAWVTDQSTVNRATLHFAPLIVVFVVLAFRAFAEPGPRPIPAPPSRRRERRRPLPEAARIDYPDAGSASSSAAGAFSRSARR